METYWQQLQQADRLFDQGDRQQAMRVYQRLADHPSVSAHVWFQMATILHDWGHLASSRIAYDKSLGLHNRNDLEGRGVTHHQLGKTCFRLGRVDQACQHLQSAFRLTGSSISLLNWATIVPGAPSATHDHILAVRQRYAQRLVEEEDIEVQASAPLRTQPPHTSRTPTGDTPRSHRRLRVGYLSAHFAQMNYMKPVWAAINHHDRDRVELHLLADIKEESSFPGYRAHVADRIHSVGDLGNDQLADQIAELELDVLVDLSGFSESQRLSLFLRRPAAHTVAWFNAFATTGLPGVDTIVGDKQVVRRSEYAYFSERVMRLPVSYLTFLPSESAPPVAPAPLLRNGVVTFGSLVSQYKLTQPVLDAYADILHHAPDSRLMLANAQLGTSDNTQYMENEFHKRGVDSNRLTFLGPADHRKFLSYYDQIDIALDAFPYNGGTTTMEAIWQGVPVLTCQGDRWAARTSQTILRKTHLAEYVAPSVSEMIQQALRLARFSGSTLQALRSEMRRHLARSSACDGPKLAKYLERIFASLP